jgi:hypothetical protein
MCPQKVVITVRCKRPRKKLQGQGAQIPRNETYKSIRRKPAPAKAGEECSATQHMDFLRGR